MSRDGFQEWLAANASAKPLNWKQPDRSAIAEMVRGEWNVSGRCVNPACHIQMLHPRHRMRP